ncbi:hypothetical protein KUTeg_015742 [Tegillarca granosa]|uniref:Uncharacterized protein n=1 Tax=Tegillarca granosa TaxID=220873 RepID=A0ABQ9ERY5_TEGGR|nr:hypothetical protein KUTeg_015742 [Tegillarca granosa]
MSHRNYEDKEGISIRHELGFTHLAKKISITDKISWNYELYQMYGCAIRICMWKSCPWSKRDNSKKVMY